MSAQYHRPDVTSHRGMKKVFGLDRKTPTRILLQHTRLYPVEYRFNLKLYALVYRCLHNLTSPLLCNIFFLRAWHGARILRNREHMLWQRTAADGRTECIMHHGNPFFEGKIHDVGQAWPSIRTKPPSLPPRPPETTAHQLETSGGH